MAHSPDHGLAAIMRAVVPALATLVQLLARGIPELKGTAMQLPSWRPPRAECRAAVMGADGLPHTSKLLSAGIADAQWHAVIAVARLTVCSDAWVLAIIGASALPALVQLLSSGNQGLKRRQKPQTP